MFISLFVSLFFFTSNGAQAQVADIQKSHIEANIPSTRAEFDLIMKRDLTSYFKKKYKNISNIDFRLLRDGPTQSGVAYPKFYAWIEIKGDGKTLDSGAIRVAAIEKKTVEVTDFFSQEKINANPSAIESVFPASLCENIREEAKKSQR